MCACACMMEFWNSYSPFVIGILLLIQKHTSYANYYDCTCFANISINCNSIYEQRINSEQFGEI